MNKKLLLNPQIFLIIKPLRRLIPPKGKRISEVFPIIPVIRDIMDTFRHQFFLYPVFLFH